MSMTALADAPRGVNALPLWLGLIGVVVLADQLSKQWVLDHFVLHEVRPLTAWFNLVLVYNTGAAFSFLAQAGGWQKWFFLGLAVVICAWLGQMLWQHRAERLLPAALSLVIGGAIGNVIDRLRHDAVVDFIDWHVAGWHWPAFNLADSAICLGVALMLLDQFRRPHTPHEETP